jgi:uncharacterized protein YdhG (YjbR/CyaY superfamily)
MLAKPKTFDAYLAALPTDRREALEKLRKTIKAIVPNAEECISYSMPAFRVDGPVIAGFRATSKGCSYYPFSGRTLATLAADLASYDQTKSALHFDPERPLPRALVRKLLTARLAETARPRGTRPARAPTKTSGSPRSPSEPHGRATRTAGSRRRGGSGRSKP